MLGNPRDSGILPKLTSVILPYARKRAFGKVPFPFFALPDPLITTLMRRSGIEDVKKLRPGGWKGGRKGQDKEKLQR